MKPITNTFQFKPGDELILIDGENVPIGAGMIPYGWCTPEEVDSIIGDTIYFKGFPSVTCYKTYMSWKVEEKDDSV